MNKSSLHNFLLETLNKQESFGLDSYCSFIFNKITFCHSAAVSLFGISEYMIKTVLKEHKCGKTMFVHNNNGSFYLSERRDRAISFIEQYAKIHCENMPDRSVMRLPSYMNINMVYLNYVDSVPKELLLEKRSFYRVFNTIFGAVHRIPLDKQRITFLPKHTHPVCSECARIQDLCNGAKLESDRIYAEQRKKSHLLEIRKKFLKSCERKELAIRFPESYLYIMMDDIDQMKIKSPFVLKNTKECSGMLRLNNHCTGVLVYNGKIENDRHVLAYVNNDQFPQDSNKTISILYDVLFSFQNLHGQLPKKLFIQTDNCAKDLKNQYVFAFYWALVELNIFEEILVSHMPVGHTHGAVDQVFSVVAAHLRKTELPTYESLIRELKSLKIKSNFIDVREMIFTTDFVKRISPCMLNIEGHTSFAQFKFRKEDRKTKMYVKADELDSSWQFGSGIKLFERLPSLINLSVAPFREYNEYSTIFSSVWNKYIPTLWSKFCTEEVERIKSQWESRITNLINLRVEDYSAFDIYSLKPIVVENTDVNAVQSPPVKEPALRATFYPIEPRPFQVSELVKDCTIMMYTKTKTSRPWVGLYLNKSTDGTKIHVQWLKKERKFYVPDNLKSGSPYVSEVSIESVMFSHVMSNVSYVGDRNGPYLLDRETKTMIMDAYVERDQNI